MGQRLRREQIEGAGGGIVEETVEDRQVIAQGFARGGRRGDRDVLALGEGSQRCRLMRVDLVDAAFGQGRAQTIVEGVRPRRVGAGRGGQTPPGGDVARELEIELQRLHGFGDGHDCPQMKRIGTS